MSERREKLQKKHCCFVSSKVTFVWAEGCVADSRRGLECACPTRGEHHGCGCVSHHWTAPLAPGNHKVSCKNQLCHYITHSYSAPHKWHIVMMPLTSHRAHAQRPSHPGDLQTLQKQNQGGSWPPKRCGEGHNSQTLSPILFCFHYFLNFQHRPCSQGGIPDAWLDLK